MRARFLIYPIFCGALFGAITAAHFSISCAAEKVGAKYNAVLASAEFTKDTETYRGVPYLWLGNCDLSLTIDTKPQANHALELLWGAKNDTREAIATINGEDLRVHGGGYDGFRWLKIPVPAGIAGEKYTITLKQSQGRAGFIAAVRLVGSDSDNGKSPLKIVVATTLRARTSAARQPSIVFPEMQKIWNTPAPRPTKPLADETLEAAFRAAEKHGRQANEMFFRSRRLVDGWLAHADPDTGLLPRRINGRDRTIWNAKDCAADLYPFLTLTCNITDRKMFDGRMREILDTETRLCSRIGRMPDTYSFTDKSFAADKPDLNSIMFGSSEYLKDGLLPLTEWLGDSPWRNRMIGILDDMWKHAPIETPYGKIVSTNFEVNGEMLQVLSRVYWMTGDEKYLEWAVRLGDYYLLGDHHPTRANRNLSLDDHGCEAVSGLCELYAAVHFARPEKKKAYQTPLHEMLDTILEKGRTEHGVFYNSFNPVTGNHARELTDNWGYNLNGFYTVYLIDKTPEYRQAVLQALSNLSKHYMDYRWEGGGADGYADSVEGAINLYNRERIKEAMPWIDNGIRKMWRKQRADGIVEGWYGDGNSARTAIMYALMKTQGLTIQPWRQDVRFGAVRDGDLICVSLYTGGDQPWTGRLVFDRPRHKEVMHLPLDYPRINQFPEWFTANSQSRYAIHDVAADNRTTVSGKQLRDGVPIELIPGTELRLIITPLRAKTPANVSQDCEPIRELPRRS